MKVKLVNKDIKYNYTEELLKERGINNFQEYCEVKKEHLQSPDCLCNIDKGIEIFLKALESEKPICIVVDPDCDGFTSAAIINIYINQVSPNKKVEYLLHKNKQHGLEDLIEVIINKENDYSLLICPDSSSNDYEYHERLNIPILVLDHHLAEPPFSEKAVIINNQLSPNYNNKFLTGAGITWQFCRKCDEILETNFAMDLIDLAAWGIIGDMGSYLNLENKFIIDNGLKNINNYFFQSLIEKQSFSMKNRVNFINIAFYIVPIINAIIRVGTLKEKEKLYLSFIRGKEFIPSEKRGAKGLEEYRAIESAREGTNAKTRQNRLKESLVKKIEEEIEKYNLTQHKILFVKLQENEENFPLELNGLAATVIANKYKKPTLIGRINQDSNEIKGSIRSPNNSPLPCFKSYLEKTGYFNWVQGHEGSAGFSIEKDNIDKFLEYTDKDLLEVEFNDSYYEVNFQKGSNDKDLCDLIFDIGSYEDLWGQGNDTPMVYVNNINIHTKDIHIIGKNKDTVKWEKNNIVYIKFFAKELISRLEQHNGFITIEVVGTMSINEYNNQKIPQIIIEDCEVIDSNLLF